jgi:hypothetical protein
MRRATMVKLLLMLAALAAFAVLVGESPWGPA